MMVMIIIGINTALLGLCIMSKALEQARPEALMRTGPVKALDADRISGLDRSWPARGPLTRYTGPPKPVCC